MRERSKKIHAKKALLETERQKLIVQERAAYEKRIKELEAEVAKYKGKYQEAKRRLGKDNSIL